MKAGLLAIATLAAVAVAVPHNHRHRHPKRDNSDVVVTEVDQVVVTDEVLVEELIYVDGAGNPTSTGLTTVVKPMSTSITDGQPQAPPQGASGTQNIDIPVPTLAVTSDVAAHGPPPANTAPANPPSTPELTSVVAGASPASTPTTAAASSPQPAAGGSSSGSSSPIAGFGLSYSPYDNNGGCKTQDQINSELGQMSGYSMVRIYGTDCNQFGMVLSAARAQNMKLFAGVYDINQVQSETQSMIDAANGNWDGVDTINVGNELVNNNQASVDEVLQAMGTARTMLQKAGYPGRVVTVDTFVAVKNNPQLCLNSDYAAVNCHPFFDGGVTADQAGEFVLQQAQEVSQACNGKDTVITETGWPWQGTDNRMAVPSISDQQAALASLKSKFSSNVILLSAFDELWKQTSASTFDAERYWGILNKAQ